MAAHDQNRVWDNVRRSNAQIAGSLSASQSVSVAGVSSYAKVFDSEPVKEKMAEYGGIETEQSMLRELRSKGATGVVVAVNGRVLWADVFASSDLLAKYWPKLVRSYVAEAITSTGGGDAASLGDAQLYISQLDGGREIAETEPGIFRRTDVTGDGYRVFELTSLCPRRTSKSTSPRFETRNHLVGGLAVRQKRRGQRANAGAPPSRSGRSARQKLSSADRVSGRSARQNSTRHPPCLSISSIQNQAPTDLNSSRISNRL